MLTKSAALVSAGRLAPVKDIGVSVPLCTPDTMAFANVCAACVESLAL